MLSDSRYYVGMYVVTVEPLWGFSGEYSIETVKVIIGYTYGKYVSITSLEEVPNRHPSPAEHFSIHSRDVLPYIEDGENIIGIVHRHPPKTPMPSINDILGIPAGLLGAVWCDGEVSWYTRNGITDVRYLLSRSKCQSM